MDWLKFHHRLLIGLLTAGLVYGCAPVGLTSQPSTEATPTLSLHTPVTDCPANLVHDSSSQAGYREWLFPGLTSREEVEERLGEPDSRGLYNRVWYEESEEDHYTFLQIQYTDGIATSLMTNDTGLSLGQALEMYGCPDFIYGTWSSWIQYQSFIWMLAS